MFKIKRLIFFACVIISSMCVVIGNLCPPCECGRTNRRGRVIGGDDVQIINEYPWITMIYYRSKFVCGGNLINSKYILTAAHCFVNSLDPFDYVVHLLRHNTKPRMEKKPFIFRKAGRIIRHERYSNKRLVNNILRQNVNADIALIRLDKDVLVKPFSNVLAPICLPDSDFSFNGYTAIFAGWGHNSIRKTDPQVLQKLRVTINNYKNCHVSEDSSDSFGQHDKLCAKNEEDGRGACYGDSGGPLQLRLNYTKAYHVIGLISYGTDRCENYTPVVFTRVGYYLEWIFKNTRDACPCSSVVKRKTILAKSPR